MYGLQRSNPTKVPTTRRLEKTVLFTDCAFDWLWDDIFRSSNLLINRRKINFIIDFLRQNKSNANSGCYLSKICKSISEITVCSFLKKLNFRIQKSELQKPSSPEISEADKNSKSRFVFIQPFGFFFRIQQNVTNENVIECFCSYLIRNKLKIWPSW